MAVLLTGGSGKTSTSIASLLASTTPPVPHLSVSRKSEVKFDWLDESTFANPFHHTFPHGAKISAVYLVSPEIPEPAPCMISFIEYCINKHGVTRFVMLTGSNASPDNGVHNAPVWRHLIDRGVEYAVLQATWFMDNLVSTQGHLLSIKHENKIYTACGGGEIPFVSVDDIAAVAVRLLTDARAHNREYRILGPRLLTYDDVASTLSRIVGRRIEHVKLEPKARTEQLMGFGMSQDRAEFLAWLENEAAKNGEKRSEAGGVEEVTGQKPMTLEAWAVGNKAAWV